MPISTVAVSTPMYVLIDGKLRIGPKVVRSEAGTSCSPIYGFSGKESFDKFCSNSQRALKPYPLVNLYLQSQIDTPGDSLKLVVLDAAGPFEPCIHAATMEAVLEARVNRAAQVIAAYGLTFDEVANAYRIHLEHDAENEQVDVAHA